MVKYLLLIMCIGVLLLNGCASQPSDERINMGKGVGGDTLSDNIITRLPAYAISALLGEGIEVNEVIENRTREGFLDVQIRGYNNAYGIKRFDYRVEWLDVNDMVIPTKTSMWVPVSAMGKSEVTFRLIAPNKEAVNFRINTRKNKVTK